MRPRYEEEPDEPDEPDEPEEPETAAAGSSPMVPAIPLAGREFEYRTEQLTSAQVTDGKTLAERLTKSSADGWDLVEIVNAGDQHTLLLRKPKTNQKENRAVGFAPPGR